MTPRRFLLLGATSSIAVEVARKLARDGNELLLVARSEGRLLALQSDLSARGASRVHVFVADLDDMRLHAEILAWARRCCPDFDTVLLAYGTMFDQNACEACVELTVQQLYNNFVTPAALLTSLADYFARNRKGCIAVITSVAGDRGRLSNYVYGSAKGGLTVFLQGLRARLGRSGVAVITIKPGPVKTRMTDHMQRGRAFAEVDHVAGDIYRALNKREPGVLYTPWPWRYIMLLIRLIPERLFRRLTL